jgi:hypothetical protein
LTLHLLRSPTMHGQSEVIVSYGTEYIPPADSVCLIKGPYHKKKHFLSEAKNFGTCLEACNAGLHCNQSHMAINNKHYNNHAGHNTAAQQRLHIELTAGTHALCSADCWSCQQTYQLHNNGNNEVRCALFSSIVNASLCCLVCRSGSPASFAVCSGL